MRWLPKLLDLTRFAPDLTGSTPALTELAIPSMVSRFVIRNYAIGADTICSSAL